MKPTGFQAMADATLLLIVLLVASTIGLSMAAENSPDAGISVQYAEDTRNALFRTTPDELSFVQDGVTVHLADGTSIESFLRIQIHILNRGLGTSDFRDGNDRITTIAMRLLRPGWSWAILGGLADSAAKLQVPRDLVIPTTHATSSWSYPALDGSGADATLSLVVWLSPRR